MGISNNINGSSINLQRSLYFFKLIEMSISCRHPEYSETAAPSITGPAPSSGPAPSPGPAPAASAASTKRAVSNGTVETMRQKSACCLGSSSCLQSEHLTPKSYLYHLLQNSENLQLKHFYWTKPDVFLGLTNSLTSALRARLAVVHWRNLLISVI